MEYATALDIIILDIITTVSIVSHISRSGAELGISFDYFIHSINEVFLCGNLRGEER